MSKFDFDAWRDLAARDPQAYFRERERTIAAFIAAHPDSAKDLQELQAHIDKVRALSGTPLNAARELARLLGQQLESLARQLDSLNRHAARLDRLMRR